ncbi:TPA: RtcB family protein, partial [Escherichia coli]|nr:RtcB family protein [Escherichia coli]
IQSLSGNKGARTQLIFEEAPQAYKSAESVVQCLVLAGLIIPVARLRPVLTLKNSGGKKG